MNIAWLVPALPFAGFLILTLGWRMPRTAAAVVGAGSVGLSMVAAIVVAVLFGLSPGSYTIMMWEWIDIKGLIASFSLTIDALSTVMMLVVTVVGFLIHVYSTDHMAGEKEGYSRFFAGMNLFVGSMLLLVMADNLLLLYLGWEGVGLCSWLLIGFWHKDPANGRAANKAFIVTRIGDVALMVALFIIALNLGTFSLSESAARAVALWQPGAPIAIAVTALILGGAVGKSAQIPLQTWLPDAMAGPSPVSALIHAATMVTAGVYLIARTHAFFTLAPVVQLLVGVVGAATLFTAGVSALFQNDIKRILAYSTMSQIGYMFLALGAGVWAGAIFHLVTHAFFKSLLFLSAGVVITAMHEEHDIHKMGGLARKMPFTFWVFLIGCFGLAAIPPVTTGFSSKDLIMSAEWASGSSGHILWAVALAGVFLTSVYTFRMLFLAFGGKPRSPLAESPHRGRAGPVMGFSLAVLALFCLIGGLLNFPQSLGGRPFLFDFLSTAFPERVRLEGGGLSELDVEGISLLVSLAGIPVAWAVSRLSAKKAAGKEAAAKGLSPLLSRFFRSGWGFDALYKTVIVRPLLWLAGVNAKDVVNVLTEGTGGTAMLFSRALRGSQTGRLRWYAFGLAAGGLIIVAAVVLL
jgi:NADH-quinone oxidoreductase subunit L